MSANDTIAAVASGAGAGAVAIIRVSGPHTQSLAQALLGKMPRPRQATLSLFSDVDGNGIDQGLAIFFPAPRSFTGEDVLELHAHGAPVVLDMLLKRLLALGARLARPGEFSERAFLNGKLDLAQAEAVADLISAGSEAAARSALRSLQGEFSRRVRDLVDALIELRTYVEAAVDFPEEEIDFLSDRRVLSKLDELRQGAAQLLAASHQGCLLQTGLTVALVGPPNVGKSSLLNALVRYDAAIVSSAPGTTRDVLRERIHIDGLPLHVVDTAGLRATRDEVEAQGVQRAKTVMAQADHILLVLDDSLSGDEKAAHTATALELPAHVPRTLVFNKIDLSGRPAGKSASARGCEIFISAKTGAGLEILREHLKQCAGFHPVEAGTFMARRRHLEALRRVQAHLETARTELTRQRAGELLAEELRQAQRVLGEITGEFTSDDLLARIFSSFCIGK